MSKHDLMYEKDGPVATIILNRPTVHNALTSGMIRELAELGREYDRDESTRVLVLTGAGTRAFCVGRDLGSSQSQTEASVVRRHEAYSPGERIFSDVEKPVIAAINGYAVGGGAELMLSTDIRVASEHAIFGFPEVTLGLVPYGGAHVRLPQQIPWPKAMEMLLTGDSYSAADAMEMGLVNYVVPQAEVLSKAHELADRIARNGPVAVRKIKKAVVAAYNSPFAEAFQTEWSIAAEALATRDAQEGISAFLEHRRPNFHGR